MKGDGVTENGKTANTKRDLKILTELIEDREEDKQRSRKTRKESGDSVSLNQPIETPNDLGGSKRGRKKPVNC